VAKEMKYTISYSCFFFMIKHELIDVVHEALYTFLRGLLSDLMF